MRITFILTILFCFSLLVVPVGVQAQGADLNSQTNAFVSDQGAGFRKEPLDPREVVATIINSVLGLMGVAFLIYFIHGSYLIMTAAGIEERVTNGRKTIVRASIGVLVILGAYSVSLFVANVLLGDPGRQGSYFEVQETPFNPDPLSESQPYTGLGDGVELDR